MKILPHELPGQKPVFNRARTIHDMTDAELSQLGWWRLSNLSGVTIPRSTIRRRVLSGMDKRLACTRPTNRSATWKKPTVDDPKRTLTYYEMVRLTGIPRATLWHRINVQGMSEDEAIRRVS